ncbi:hypothetical protein [Rhizobium laguerreae]|uniref:hypothetical protein n=1 Tax=Rhizobium laguerreae TaxID=1076926 RepID=UPI001FEEF394|nr:hypothetical protein [Rhizobium laguerreae]
MVEESARPAVDSRPGSGRRSGDMGGCHEETDRWRRSGNPKDSRRVHGGSFSHEGGRLVPGKAAVFVVSPRLTAVGLFAERMFARSRRRAEGLQERLLAIGVFRRPWARSSSLSTPKKTAAPRIAFKSDWSLEAPGALRSGRAAGKVVIDVA